MTDVSSVRTPELDVDALAVNALRFLAIDAVQKANSGHPGMPMGTAAMAWALWSRHLKHDPQDPAWFDRDRFVLSAGHGSMLLYGLLHLFGYDLPIEEIKQFRQWGSRTPGHPENFITAGVETTTGPLGQGFANAVGLAMAERFVGARFNRPDFTLVDHHTYVIASDGDLMEGISHEAASMAGHLGLGKLICLYDDNRITIDGSTDITFTEDVAARFAAYGWHVARIEDGNDLDAVDEAVAEARAEHGRPSLLLARTHIGYGSPGKQDTSSAHGSPLGEDEIARTRETLGWTHEPFSVPDAAYAAARSSTGDAADQRVAWTERLSAYRTAHPEAAKEFDVWMSGRPAPGWESRLPVFSVGDAFATRQVSGKVLSAVAPVLTNLVGGSADLAGSNNTTVPDRTMHDRDNPGGETFNFGVREHAMGGICNGLSLHGGIRPFCATFLVFSDYMRPSIRLAALMGRPVVYVFTHDSIGLGEDGPTHQPVEHLLALRAIPGLVVLRPADAAETTAAWRVAIERTDGPTVLALTRQKIAQAAETLAGSAEGVARGAYVLRGGGDNPSLILVATGSEVPLVLGAADRLRQEGIAVRVVSMPSCELFDAQPKAYRDSVLPPAVTKRISVEAGVTRGWERYVGLKGTMIGLDRFGASAPAAELFERFGFTADRIVAEARALLDARDQASG